MKNLYLTLIFLSNFLTSAFAQENAGFIYTNKGSSLEPVLFEQNSSETDGFIFSNELLVYTIKKQQTHKVVVSNNRMTGEISITSENILTKSSRNYSVKYTPGECGLIFIPGNLIDTTIDIKGLYNFIVSFKDIEYKTPYINKIQTGDDEYLELERLSKILTKKHRELSAPLISKRDAQKLAEKKQFEADELIRKAEQEKKRFFDSIRIEKQKLVSLKKEEQYRSLAFQDLLIEDAEKMFKKYIYDSIKVEKINANILEEYKKRLNGKGYYNTSIEGESYNGELIKRKKVGTGFLVVNDINFFYGYFENDSFVRGLVLDRKPKVKYIGNYKNKIKNGVGRFQLVSGDYFLGNFLDGSFSGGTSLRTLEDGNKYFGAYSESKPNGFGFLKNANGSTSVGNFNNGILQSGYEFKLEGQNKIVLKKCQNFNCLPAELGEYSSFGKKLNSQFSKIYAEFNYDEMEKLEKPNKEPEVVSQKTVTEQWRLTTKRQMFNVKTKAPIPSDKTESFFALFKKRPWKGRYTVRIIKTEYDNETVEYKVISKNLIRANMLQLGFTFQMAPIAKYQNSNLNAFKLFIPQASIAWKYFGAFYGYGVYIGEIADIKSTVPQTSSTSNKQTYINKPISYHEGGLLINLGGPMYLKGGVTYLSTETINYSFSNEYFNKRQRNEYGFVAGLSFMPMGFIAELGYNHTFRSVQAGIGFNIPFKL